MKYSVTKEISFCYGHRLMNHQGLCRHLHGHSVRAAITVAAPELDANGMVCDFHDLAAAARAFVNDALDHTLLLHRDDPLAPLLAAAGERFRPMEQHPTAEAIAAVIFDYLAACGFAVQSVTLWESDSAYATVSNPHAGPALPP